MVKRIFLIALILLTLATPSSAAPLRQYGGSGLTPGVISYQGRIQVDGQAFSGTGYFKFAMVNQAGTHAWWSNDGTDLATAPFTPTLPVTLTVTNGVFNIGLGDTTVAGMTAPITATHVMTADRSLRVWFSDGSSHGWQRLSPDVPLAAVPYVLNTNGNTNGTGTAERIAEWLDSDTLQSSTLTKIGAGQLTLSASSSYTITAPETMILAGRNVVNTFLASQSVNTNSTTALVIEQDGVKDNVLVVDTTNGRVGISTASTLANYVMTIRGSWATVNSSNDIRLRLVLSGATGNPGYYSLYNGAGLESVRFHGADSSAINSGDLGIGMAPGSVPSARLHVIKTTEQLRLGYNASNYYTSFTTSNVGDLDISPSGGDVSVIGNLNVTGNIVPIATTYDLGTSALYWDDIHYHTLNSHSMGTFADGPKIYTGTQPTGPMVNKPTPPMAKVSCTDAIMNLRSTDTLMDNGMLHLDYSTIPIEAIRPASDSMLDHHFTSTIPYAGPWQVVNQKPVYQPIITAVITSTSPYPEPWPLPYMASIEQSDEISYTYTFTDTGPFLWYEIDAQEIIPGQVSADTDVMISLLLCAVGELQARVNELEKTKPKP